jgi:hypothetical protein
VPDWFLDHRRCSAAAGNGFVRVPTHRERKTRRRKKKKKRDVEKHMDVRERERERARAREKRQKERSVRRPNKPRLLSAEIPTEP